MTIFITALLVAFLILFVLFGYILFSCFDNLKNALKELKESMDNTGFELQELKALTHELRSIRQQLENPDSSLTLRQEIQAMKRYQNARD